ncbi:MAG TPA: hypothetical protein VLL75_15945 [Vicinamibacteria bacterium]|nr:hypothetical protein [Vicinamibacteria bacterium]
MSGAGAFVLVVAIGLAAGLAGRLFVGALGGTLLRRFDAAGAAASLVVGTATLTLLSVSLSAVGFPTRDLPLLIAALHLLPLAVVWRRRRLGVLCPRGRLREWATLAFPAALTAFLGLLPVVRTGGYSFGNDTYTYAAFSEWLQLHGYSEACRFDPQSPVTAIPALWQAQGYDLGMAHWLALVQAAARPASALVVYPSTSAFGLALLASTLWLAARQLLRLGWPWAGAVALVFAAVPHALYWGHHNGFLQQGYALPMVVFGLVLLARTARPVCWRASNAPLLALPFAFLASVYLPLLLLLGFAALVAFVPSALSARSVGKQRRLALFAGAVTAFFVLFAARDLRSALTPLHGFVTVVAGEHVPWSAAEFLQFALGARVLAPGRVNVEVPPWSAMGRALTPLFGGLVLAGLWLAAHRSRTRPLAAVAGLVALAAGFFAIAVKDPWRGTPGHTWNLFKLAQWGTPFVLLLAALAVRQLAPRRSPWRLAALALAFALPASQVGVHWPWSARLGEAMRDILPGTTLLQLPLLEQRIQGLPAGTLLVLGRPVNAHRWLAAAVSLLAYPRAVVADWAYSATVSSGARASEALHAWLVERWDDPRVVPIVAGFAPFQPGRVEELGGGFGRVLKQADPLIVHVVNPSGLGSDGASGRPAFSIGKGRTKVVVFSPAARSAALRLTLRPYPGRPGTRLVAFLAGGDTSHRSVRLASEGPPAAVVPLGGETGVSVPLSLPRGLATVVLVIDDGRGERDAREPVTVVGLSLGPEGATPVGAAP